MTILDELCASSSPYIATLLDGFHRRRSHRVEGAPRAGKHDNQPTWDNWKKFDNFNKKPFEWPNGG